MTRRALYVGLLAAAATLSCAEKRTREQPAPSYTDVEPLLSRSCSACHEGSAAANDVRLGAYYDALGCTVDGAPLTLGGDDAPLLAALDRPDHAQLLASSERQLFEDWLRAGAEGRASPVHGPHILDPRSEAWHGRLAAEDLFAPLRDPESEALCGRCHEGAPLRPERFRTPAPGAPACTSCHTQKAGVLACDTCHGQSGRAYPPRDACYFEQPAYDAHATHLSATRVSERPLTCATCHPPPGDALFGAMHADGQLQVQFSPLAGDAAKFDTDSGTCSVQCHARAGTHTAPTFHEQLALGCDGCHRSPPRDHYPGTCATCHAEMGASARSLRPGRLHLNGRVDLGSGDGTCAACHGKDGSPWPDDRAHAAHRDSPLTASIACASCHVVPALPQEEGHMNGRVEVSFTGRAVGADGAASFDAASGRCSNVACHGGVLRAAREPPLWNEAPFVTGCTACHAVPPSPPHIQQPACGGGLCHGDEVRGASQPYGITALGATVHIDGVVQAGGR